jgi:16S rRNA uridine-516 pseudouridylate synthase and related pseudouridylate synthases
MMEALGFTVVKLHRVEFMGIYLGGGAGAGRDSANGTSKNGLLRPGDWAYLDASEMDLVKKALQRSSLSQVSTQDASLDEKEEEQQ